MKKYIQSLFNSKVKYASPESCTDLANSLDLLSSGIYTEEERFVFELIQNAIDSSIADCDKVLSIKIIIKDDFIIFMHNGKPFTKRDIEGICSVGNGNKSGNIKKIGYKGIGFKSVFMHSKEVYIKTGNVILKFEEKYWSDFFGDNSISISGRKYKMPWQIIPILSSSVPIKVDTEGYNVCTYIHSLKIKSLADKLQTLLKNAEILLFLKNRNIEISYYNDQTCCRVLRKTTEKTVKFNNKEEQLKIDLVVDNKVKEQWIVYTNNKVSLSDEQVLKIENDPRTPQKLIGCKTFDLSFAIHFDRNNNICPVENSVLYTYLPTSYQFGFPFLVNANFITDAGRQQLNDNAEWNKAVINQIPIAFLKWIGKIALYHNDYYKILPPLVNSQKELGLVYNNAATKAFNFIPFIPNLEHTRLLLASEALIDTIELTDAFTEKKFNDILSHLYSIENASDRLVDNNATTYLKSYGVRVLCLKDFYKIIENASILFSEFSINDIVTLIKWTNKHKEIFSSDGLHLLSNSPILLDENNKLSTPSSLFLPSDYSETNECVTDAKIISVQIAENLKDLKHWLLELGVSEMSSISIVEHLFCKEGYITKDNAISVMQFIFDANIKENLLNQIPSYLLRNLRILSKNDELHVPSDLYLTDAYQTNIKIDSVNNDNFFISSKYIRPNDNSLEWSLFFKKIGVNDEIKISSITCDENSPIYIALASCRSIAHTKYRTWNLDSRKFYVQNIPSICVQFCPLIILNDNDYNLKKLAWNNILGKNIYISNNGDYIHAHTGMGWYLDCYLTEYEYLGMPFIQWALKHYSLLPDTTGHLSRIQEVMENTPYNKELCGKYFPVLNIDTAIHHSWREYLQFKKDLSLSECLEILKRISEAPSCTKDNLDRISRIYDKICCYDILDGSIEWKTINNWGKYNTILTKDYTFINPTEMVLVDYRLGKIDIHSQMFTGKHVDYKTNRFVNFIKALGVRFIDDFKPRYKKIATDDNFKEQLFYKRIFIALVSAGSDITQDNYDRSLADIEATLEKITFQRDETINLCYGEKVIAKKTYVDGNHFHYVGNLNSAIIDLILPNLAILLKIPIPARSTLNTLIQLTNVQEVKDYLQEKGYDISILKKKLVPEDFISEKERKIEFKGKILVYEKLLSMGYHPVCPSISTEDDYEQVITIKGKDYYCKTNYDKYDITFETKSGITVYLEVKATTRDKSLQENMPISYRELSMIEECDTDNNCSYMIVRVFGIDKDTQDFYLFTGHLLKD